MFACISFMIMERVCYLLRVSVFIAFALLGLGCQGEAPAEPYDPDCSTCEPDISEPDTSEPDISEPDAGEPDTNEPIVDSCPQIDDKVFVEQALPAARFSRVDDGWQRLHFSQGKVTWDNGNTRLTGDYSCDLLGKVHASFSSDSSSMVPILLNHDGSKLRMMGDKGYTQYLLDTQGSCDVDPVTVCGKESTNLRCFIAPCDTHTYYTYSNDCEARDAKASIAFSGVCGDLEQHVAPEYQPVVVLDELIWEKSDSLSIVDYVITENHLRISLQYQGCGETVFVMYADKAFSSHLPAHVNYRFVPDFELDLSCDTSFVSEFTFDLLPIAEYYRRLHPDGEREVLLPEIGSYQLPF